MLIVHLQGREAALAAFAWQGRQADSIAAACLRNGGFTRAQLAAVDPLGHQQVHIGKARARYRLHRPVDEPPLSERRLIAFPRGIFRRERPLEGGSQRVKTRLALRHL